MVAAFVAVGVTTDDSVFAAIDVDDVDVFAAVVGAAPAAAAASGGRRHCRTIVEQRGLHLQRYRKDR